MMEIFKTPNPCLLLFLVLLLSFSILTPLGTAETTRNQPEAPVAVPKNEGNNAPLLDSLPNDTPVNNIPFAKPVGGQGQQSQLGSQQQQYPNYPQQSINQPLSGFSQPYSTINQPYSGFKQPFGAASQQGSLDNAAFDNGGSKEKTCIQGVVLVSLLTLMVCFGFLV